MRRPVTSVADGACRAAFKPKAVLGIDFPSREMAVQRQRARPTDTECQEPGNVEEIGLVARSAKVSTQCIVGQQLDRAKSIREMNGKDSYQQHHDHRRGGHWNEGAEE